MPPRQNDAGRWEQQKRSPPNARGERRRLYVVCPPEKNSPAFCRALMAQAIERWVSGQPASRETFERFARDRFLKEYPAARGLRPSSRDLLAYLLDKVIIPEIGRLPLSSVDAGGVARLLAKLKGAERQAPATRTRVRRALAPTTVEVAIKVTRRMLRAALLEFPPRSEVVDAARAYLAEMRSKLTPGSFAIYAQALELHVLPRIGRMRIGAVDDVALANLAERLGTYEAPAVAPAAATVPGSRRYSDQTLRHVVMTIKSVLSWAETTHAIGSAPKLHLPKVAEARKPRPYSRDEARALIGAAADEEERALFLVTFDLGLRKSEILGLEWSQVAFDKHVVLVDRQRYRGRDSATKSGREREVPLTAVTESALKKIRRPGVRYVFADDIGAAREETWIRTTFKRARKKASLRHVRWHDHRHFFSTMRTDQGVAPFVLRELLGHADIRTTQKYVHASADRLASVMDEGRAS